MFLFSCFNKTVDNNIDIPLYNGYVFKLSNGEIFTDSNTSARKIYEKYFNKKAIQIPLFKHIKHSEYDLFVGIPVNTSIDEISKTVIEKHNIPLKNYKNDNNFCYNQYNSEDLYITELAIKVDEKSLFYISAITSSKIIADSILNNLELSRRIVKGKV